MLRIAHDPGPLLEIGHDRAVAPVVAVNAHLAVAVEIVQEHVIAGQLMVVGRDVLAVHHQGRIAVARRAALGVFEVAEHLVVGAVLFDDVEHVLDRAVAAGLVGDAAVALGHRAVDRLRRVGRVLLDLLRVTPQGGSVGPRDRGDRALQELARMIEGHAIARPFAAPAADSSAGNEVPCRWPPTTCGCRATRPGRSDTSRRE